MDTLARKYRKLLVADESLESVRQSAELVEQALGGRLILENGGVRFQQLSRSARGAILPQNNGTHQVDSPADLAQLMQALVSPSRSKQSLALQKMVEQASILLAVAPRLATSREPPLPDDRYSLLMDACLVLFHHVHFALLPELPAPDWEPQRSALLWAIQQFAAAVPNFTDRANVLALYYDATDQAGRALAMRRDALRATPADDHEFLTDLQSCWTDLIDQQQWMDALGLLLDAYPRVTRNDLEEMHELIAQTFKLQASHYEALLVAH